MLRRNLWVRRGRRLLKRMQWPLAILALLVVPALIVEDRTTSRPIWLLCNAVNWFVWLAFIAEFCIGFAVARSARTFLRSAWFKLAIILLSPPFLVPEVFQATRGLRAFRILRLFRLMRALAITTIGLRSARKVLGSHGFPYVLLVTVATIALGAIGIYQVEHGFTIDSPMFTPVDGLWNEEPLSTNIAEIAGGSFLRRDPPDIKGSGYVVRSLEAALWAFAKSTSFEHGALLAVNLGNDADTTGAVYGQIAGAYYGVDGIPERWRRKLAQLDLLESFAIRLMNSSR